MALRLQSFTSLVQTSAAAMQGAAAQLVNLDPGSVIRAILEASASIALWIQFLILQVLALTRAATSQGTDLDSWCADFGLARLPAVASSGQVTFSRFTATNSALIPVGTRVKTSDGTQSFLVIADATNAYWNAALNGFLIHAGTSSAAVTVRAVNRGTGGNVQAGTITALGTSIPYIDFCSNASAFTNGITAETDAAFRARFVLYINTRSRATAPAIAFAIVSVQQGLAYYIDENHDPDLTYDLGFFTVTIDDGTGHPPSALLAAVTTAIEAYRPIGQSGRFIVQAPTITTANISVTLTVSPASSKPGVIGAVETAITKFINSLPISGGAGAADPSSLVYGKLAQAIYNVSPNIILAEPLTINGADEDVTVAKAGVIKAGTVAVG